MKIVCRHTTEERNVVSVFKDACWFGFVDEGDKKFLCFIRENKESRFQVEKIKSFNIQGEVHNLRESSGRLRMQKHLAGLLYNCNVLKIDIDSGLEHEIVIQGR